MRSSVSAPSVGRSEQELAPCSLRPASEHQTSRINIMTTPTVVEASTTLILAATPSLSNGKPVGLPHGKHRHSPALPLGALVSHESEHLRHRAAREELMHKMSLKRSASRERALERRELHAVRRECELRRAALVVATCEQAAREQPRFLPSMPAAAQLARQTWAADQCIEDATDRNAAVNAVRNLNDNMGTIIKLVDTWAAPNMTKRFGSGLKSLQKSATGRAPNTKFFNRVMRESAQEAT